MSIKERSISGVFWSFVQSIGSRGISFFTTIILARILLPSDFGLIGILTIFVSIGLILIDGGFFQALIQKKAPDASDYSSVFTATLIAGAVLYVIIFIGAPYIADFFEQQELVKLTRIFCIVFLIHAFSNIQEARLTKELKFRTLAVINIPSAVFSAIVAISMAYSGMGVWSLVVQQIVMKITFVVIAWIYIDLELSITMNVNSLRSLFNFGSRIMLSSFIGQIYDNLYRFLIGRYFNTQILGFYQNAETMAKQPSNVLTKVVNNVAFPVFSSFQDEDKKLRKGYTKAIQQIIFIVNPLLIITAVLATPVFRFFLTEKWLPAVPFFQLFCIGGIIYPLLSFNLNIIKVKGRGRLYLNLSLIRNLVGIAGVIIVLPYGVINLIIFQVFHYLFSFFLNSYFAGSLINYSFYRQLLDLLPILGLGVGVGIVLWFMESLTHNWLDIFRILTGYGLSILIYVVMAKVLKLQVYSEIRDNFKQQIFYR